MRLGRLLILLALVLVVGVVAIVFAFRFFTAAQPSETAEPGEEAVPLTDIVIAVQPIPRGAVISQDALGTIAFPRDETIEGMFTDPSEVVGSRARFDLDPGTPIVASMVVSSIEGISDTGSDAALLIPRGMVAISIPIDRFSSVAYGLRRGDHVNVVASMLFVDLDTEFQTVLPNNTAGVIAPGVSVITTLETEGSISSNLTINDLLSVVTAQISTGGAVSPQGRTELEPVLNFPFYIVPSEPTQRPRLVSQTVLQDVVVLHVGNFQLEEEQQPVPTPVPEEGQQQGAQAQPAQPQPQAQEVQPPDIITLIVFPQDAVTLNYLVHSGAQLTLAMRPSGDDTRVLTDAVTLQFLLDQYNIPVPAKLPYGLEPRVDELNSPAQVESPEPSQE